jgi:formamidopyrimidine-DNA glycosylase
MPELPDVESFKRYVDSTALHQTIRSVTVRSRKILRSVSPQRLMRALQKRQFQSSRRYGKWLLIELDRQHGWLALHFGMTGFLTYCKHGPPESPHVRLLIEFAGGAHLAFDCRRLLGMVTFAQNADLFIQARALGPDALAVSSGQFRSRVTRTDRPIKTVLMDQAVVAGIGNVYSDEILFHARIHPQANSRTLGERAIRTLYYRMRQVLRRAIAVHADPHRMPQSWLLPHRREGDPCPRCSSPLQRIRLNQRSTYLCSQCQRKSA